MGVGVRYGEFSVLVGVSGMVSSVYGWRCKMSGVSLPPTGMMSSVYGRRCQTCVSYVHDDAVSRTPCSSCNSVSKCSRSFVSNALDKSSMTNSIARLLSMFPININVNTQ